MRSNRAIPVAVFLLAGLMTSPLLAGPLDVEARANRPPRKVVVGTLIFSPGGTYPGLKARLDHLARKVDEMAAQASKQYPGRSLDLAILPEDAVTSMTGPAADRAVSLEGPVKDTFAALARKHKSYIVAPMDLEENGPSGRTFCNAAVLFDRGGKVAGIYRKAHPVAYVGGESLEGGITPGNDYPVFDCDFGKLGIQICWDIVFEDGWKALADRGAELVVWPSASPATILPASRAALHRYFVVSSCWRNNATVYEPTGMIAARVEDANQVLVHQVDLSYAIMGWSSFLNDGKALSDKYGRNVGSHYDPREDIGLFWSNDPAMSIGRMIRSIGGEDIDRQIERNRKLQDAARGAPIGSNRSARRDGAKPTAR